MKNGSQIEFVEAFAAICFGSLVLAAIYSLFAGLFTVWPMATAAIAVGVLALIWIVTGGPRRCRDRRTRRESERYWGSPEGQKVLEEHRASRIAEARATEVAQAERENRPRPSLRVLRAGEWRPPPIVLPAELERLVEPCLEVIRLTNTASVPVFMTHLRVSRTDAELLFDALSDRGILVPRMGDMPSEILVDLNQVI